nr:hypothetical protein [Tanacetum cinerariifolium]
MGKGSNANETGGQDRASLVRKCTFLSSIKCNPTPFHGEICCCHPARQSPNVVEFPSGHIRTQCCNREVLGDMKKMMMEEFYLDEEVPRMEDELRSLKLRDTNIASYTQRFNELVILCPKAVPTEKNMVEAYIKGLHENIKGKWPRLDPLI